MDYRFEFFMAGAAFGAFVVVGVLGLLIALLTAWVRGSASRWLRGL